MGKRLGGGVHVRLRTQNPFPARSDKIGHVLLACSKDVSPNPKP